MLSKESPLGMLAVAALVAWAPLLVRGEDPVGTWDLNYSASRRERTGRLSITRSADTTLSGRWRDGRGLGEISDLKFEGGKLTFVRKLKFRGREVRLDFQGTIEGDKLTGTLSSPRGEMAVRGSRVKSARPRTAESPRRQGGRAPESPPTHRNVKYGPHPRHVLDFWRAESKEPTPLVVYIHGGGFRGGSKESLNGGTLRQLLAARISVAAINYRLVSHEPLPAAHHDCRRALQFLRSKSKEWNIDKARVGAFGGSAGAQLCMYLGFHDEMADPQSPDPVARESTRLKCVATSGGQTTMDFRWWKKFIPGYEAPHRNPLAMFGVETEDAYLEIVKEVSALSLISSDDPPIFMSYGMPPDAPIPDDPQRAQGWKVHHVTFGVKLKETMDRLRVGADLKYPGAKSRYRSNVEFFIEKLAKRERATL